MAPPGAPSVADWDTKPERSDDLAKVEDDSPGLLTPGLVLFLTPHPQSLLHGKCQTFPQTGTLLLPRVPLHGGLGTGSLPPGPSLALFP